MPDGVVGGDLRPRHRADGQRPHGDEDSVVVDLSSEDVAKLRRDLDDALSTLERVQAGYEREVADGKRVRAEGATLRERIEELRAQVRIARSRSPRTIASPTSCATSSAERRRALAPARTEMGEMAENMAARERQAARAQEDAGKIREDMEDMNRQLMELSRTKDEGWKKLNEQLTEIEHLREVINEQERMLEERRVGLISQEEVIKELRAEKEQTSSQSPSSRPSATSSDDLAHGGADLTPSRKRTSGSAVLVEPLQRGSAGGGSSRDDDHEVADHTRRSRPTSRICASSSRRSRPIASAFEQKSDRSEGELERQRGQVAQVEVELQDAHARRSSRRARQVAQDALAKAEVARHKAAEEALIAARPRTRPAGWRRRARELDKLRKKVAELEDGDRRRRRSGRGAGRRERHRAQAQRGRRAHRRARGGAQDRAAPSATRQPRRDR